MSDDRIPVPDPALMRRAGKRMILALIPLLFLATLIAVWGIVLVAAGEVPGLPLLVGGVVLAVAAVTLTVSGFRVRRTLRQSTVSRASSMKARQAAGRVRIATLITMVLLVVFGLLRVISGEWWSLLTALMVSAVLYFLASGAKTVVKAQERSLTELGPNP